jgi:hypothetical protein
MTVTDLPPGPPAVDPPDPGPGAAAEATPVTPSGLGGDSTLYDLSGAV